VITLSAVIENIVDLQAPLIAEEQFDAIAPRYILEFRDEPCLSAGSGFYNKE